MFGRLETKGTRDTRCIRDLNLIIRKETTLATTNHGKQDTTDGLGFGKNGLICVTGARIT